MRLTITAAVLALLASPALAAECPGHMGDIDAALEAGTELSAEDLARVEELRMQGEEQHASGDHGASVASLAEAKMLLGIE
ncbi:hypothetical protein GE300_01480 [Rhodobacteraceae bacterium 2CG4]|uniref:Uncharacterized protein n=1 Tax=Halovulum marinum TaxID=2662447 RepID=A0A6L5YV36_9RHOB|nr:hypothetical protein [Halovulum marinum]MSU88286.1 hypothetical protein [Halovulum marinum]